MYGGWKCPVSAGLCYVGCARIAGHKKTNKSLVLWSRGEDRTGRPYFARVLPSSRAPPLSPPAPNLLASMAASSHQLPNRGIYSTNAKHFLKAIRTRTVKSMLEICRFHFQSHLNRVDYPLWGDYPLRGVQFSSSICLAEDPSTLLLAFFPKIKGQILSLDL